MIWGKSTTQIVAKIIKIDVATGRTTNIAAMITTRNIMPDLTGISLREFLSIYPQGKFAQYEITGSGVVVSQFPEKGTKLDKQTKIQIMLE